MSARRIKGAVMAAVILAAAIAITIAGSRPEEDIISWFEGDMDGDQEDELLVITGSGRDMALDTGEPYGTYVKMYSRYEIVNKKPVLKQEPDYVFDLGEIKPLKIQAGDINGDGVEELGVCVYKRAEFHPVFAKRPFFYQIADGGLVPIWLGSRLARPFTDYILFDVDEDGIDEIISIELLENENKVIGAYDWKGFGFEVKALSDELEGEAVFLTNINRREGSILVEVNGGNYRLELENDKLRLREQ